MAKIDTIAGASTLAGKKNEERALGKTAQEAANDNALSSIADVKPDLPSFAAAEALGKALGSTIDESTLEAQTSGLDEARIRALLDDE